MNSEQTISKEYWSIFYTCSLSFVYISPRNWSRQYFMEVYFLFLGYKRNQRTSKPKGKHCNLLWLSHGHFFLTFINFFTIFFFHVNSTPSLPLTLPPPPSVLPWIVKTIKFTVLIIPMGLDIRVGNWREDRLRTLCVRNCVS